MTSKRELMEMDAELFDAAKKEVGSLSQLAIEFQLLATKLQIALMSKMFDGASQSEINRLEKNMLEMNDSILLYLGLTKRG